MKKLNVLVFPCGSENAGEIAQALRYSLHVGRLIGASSCEDHGRFHFADYIGDVPYIHAPEFEAYFLDLLATHHIDVIFATHDTVCEKLAEMEHLAGSYLVNGQRETTRIARRKSLTYGLFANATWSPTVYPAGELPDAWPVIVKPDCGQGGNGVALAHNDTQLTELSAAMDSPVVVEYLPGKELTVDCFTNRHGELVWVGPRTRERVRAGIAMRAQQVAPDEEITTIAGDINAALALRGPWFFQLKADKQGKWKLLEISCRVSGTMVFQRARGVNLPLMALHDFMGRDVATLPNNDITLIERRISTRARIDREYQHVYVDLDDTLIIDGYVVPAVVSFIYQSIAEGKKVYLITRHEYDVHQTLEKVRLSPGVFDGIYHVQDRESKANYIKPDSIFIDNYFIERKDVFEKTQCLVLDVDAVALLLR